MSASADVYKQDVDFTALALQYPSFSKRLKPNGQLDFSDPESVIQLTKALLRRDFNLTIELPEDRLCPPVPNRFNYILFAQKLLDTTRPDFADSPSSSDRVIGLDIGTGASAIYPLLACRQRPTWAFLATEIDLKSRSYAERNIASNQLQSRIKIVDTDSAGHKLLPSSEIARFDDYAIRIQLTNPPFYASETELIQSAKSKSRPPNSACTGAPVEMIVDGGEVGFVTRLIQESASEPNRSKIQWFSSMLGKLSSVGEVVEQLKQAQCSNYATTEFIQGQKTRRWCVAWSWFSLRPPTALARGIHSLDKRVLPFPSDFEFDMPTTNVFDAGEAVDQAISALDLTWRYTSAQSQGVGVSRTGDVWSRKARRKQRLDSEMEDVKDVTANDSTDDDEEPPALAFRIAVQPLAVSGRPTASKVHVRWLQGYDSVLFESFCGWLKRKCQS